MNKEIKPCEGVGDIKFGMTRDELVQAIGEPDEVHQMEFDDEEGKSETWHYDYLELSVSFEENDDWRLTVISVSSEDFTLNGEKIIGMDMDAILSKVNDLGAIHVDLEEEDLGQELVIVENLHLNFWFEGSLSAGTKLTEIQLETCA